MMDKTHQPLNRPMVGGTNNGVRPQRYSYWRTGYGSRTPQTLEFWVAQAGEYHSRAYYHTGDFEHNHRQQFYYHLAGEATIMTASGTMRLEIGDLVVVPSQASFTCQAPTGVKQHWFALEGEYPQICRYDMITRYPLGYHQRIAAKFITIREILILQSPGYALQAIAIFYELLSLIEAHQAKQQTQSLFPDTVRLALTYLQEHAQEPFNAQNVADAAGVSRSYLRSLFKKWVGESPHQSHTRYRLEIASRLLQTQNLSIQEVARQVG
ncbi:MAG: AraC family transcriptional regulator, partial [Chloroflexota bacterium]